MNGEQPGSRQGTNTQKEKVKRGDEKMPMTGRCECLCVKNTESYSFTCASMKLASLAIEID